MLNGKRQKFVEGIVSGMSATDAYVEAYGCDREAARKHAGRILAEPEVAGEIARMRGEAEKLAGSAVMTLAEVHSFLSRLVRSRIALEPEDSDLFVSIKRRKIFAGDDEEPGEIIEFKLPDKLAAIARWADLKGEGSEAAANDTLAKLLETIRK